MASKTSVDVCVCTYQRTTLVDCLRSILDQQTSAALRIVVADNDEQPSARPLVDGLGSTDIPITYVHAPARNISLARNACLDAASADWIAFTDDDQTAEPGWIEALLDEADRGGWDAVLGPVDAAYQEPPPAWVQAGDFHSTRPVWVGGEILTGYAGNVLIRRALVEELGLRFRLDYGRTGGEDLDFFYRFSDGGGRIGFAPEALAREIVPPARASLRWLLRRNFRAGQSHGARLTGQPGARPVKVALAAAKAGACGLLALAHGPIAHRRNRLLVRAALHLGVVARLMGRKEITIY